MPRIHRKKKARFPTELEILEKRGRDRTFILAEILDIAKHGALKTQIMYDANLSYAQLLEFLSLVTYLGLLQEIAKGGKTIYKTTEKGLEYLDSYQGILNLLAESSPKYKYVSQLYDMSSQLRELKRAIDNLETNIMNFIKCPKCELDILAEYNYCPYCGINLNSKKQRVRQNETT